MQCHFPAIVACSYRSHSTRRGTDVEFQRFAVESLPKLREHLNQTQQLQSQLKQTDKRS